MAAAYFAGLPVLILFYFASKKKSKGSFSTGFI
jgi:ABC-type glycerol-3-phosphate transport system permease component